MKTQPVAFFLAISWLVGTPSLQGQPEDEISRGSIGRLSWWCFPIIYMYVWEVPLIAIKYILDGLTIEAGWVAVEVALVGPFRGEPRSSGYNS